ncbi:outer membrane beta-barrel protein [Marinifilum sp. N1E240]|uniref:outer membrane beta-barrel family protein n=1 Tax=Marinifilum sp. N1E240 TaxID=2608082 RepID=UPI00128DF0B8|nr:outer membrane beta-barrel family protein [Marinifilum sp. N1E240]MPQ46722.1 outer membrane beta-barrel protein [Marinifilum sp. N1E240]
MNLKFSFWKNIIVCAMLIIFSSNYAFSLNPTAELLASSVKGKIIENKHQKPLEFATVSIFCLKDSTLVKGTITNKKGEFKLEKLKADAYFLKVDYIGYNSYTLKKLTLASNEKKVLKQAISLAEDTKALEEVVVEGNREFSRMELGKTVYNVSKSPIADGGTINDVLNTVPKLSVNSDGDIQFRGSSNVKILIDGKISGLLGMNPSEVLSGMSASDVDRVELISTSSARYDATGANGIINIIMKKNRTKGFNGSASATLGTKDKKSGNFSANLRTGKINFFGQYVYKDDWAGRDYNVQRSIYETNTSLVEHADVDFGNRYHIGKIGMDFLIDDNNTITLSTTYRDILQNWNGNYEYIESNVLSSGMPDVSYRKSAVDLDLTSRIYNASYIHKFKKKGQSLSVDFAYTDNEADNSGNYSVREEPSNIWYYSGSDFYKTARKESVAQVDYVHPVGKNGKLETGYLYRNNEIDYEDQEDLSTAFNYEENIHGLYLMYTGAAGKFAYELGLRAEYSDITTNREFKDDYLDLFPSVHLSYDFSDTKKWELAYSRMIYRPNSGMLNPFQNLRDPENQRLGAQDIEAYYNHNVEMSMSYDRKKASYKTTLYINYYNTLINQYRSINDDNESVVTYGNFDNKFYSALEFEASTKLNKWWSLSGYIGGIYEKTNPGDDFNFGSRDMWEVLGKVTSIMNFKKWFKMQTSFRYQSEILTAQGKYQNLYYVDLGLSRKVLKGRGSLSFTANDIFNTFKFKIHSSDPDFYNKEIRYKETQIAKLTFRYYFGKRYRVLRAKKKSSGMKRHSELDI